MSLNQLQLTINESIFILDQFTCIQKCHYFILTYIYHLLFFYSVIHQNCNFYKFLGKKIFFLAEFFYYQRIMQLVETYLILFI